jgi:hypothetical protein
MPTAARQQQTALCYIALQLALPTLHKSPDRQVKTVAESLMHSLARIILAQAFDVPWYAKRHQSRIAILTL